MALPYALGALPSPADHRDYKVAAFLPQTPLALPPELDLTPCLQPVRDQGNDSTCAAFAGCGLMGEFAQTASPPLNRILAPRALYRDARAKMMPPGGAPGSYPRAIMAVLQEMGCPLESDCPYQPGVDTPLGPQAAEHRAQNKIATYAASSLEVQEIMAALFLHGPSLAAANVKDGFAWPGAGGVITNTGAEHGGHAFLLTGYSTQRRAWRMRNSWGTGWGDQGDAWLPWDYELWEAWWATPALVNGRCPLAPLVAWLERMFPGLHIPL